MPETQKATQLSASKAYLLALPTSLFPSDLCQYTCCLLSPHHTDAAVGPHVHEARPVEVEQNFENICNFFFYLSNAQCDTM